MRDTTGAEVRRMHSAVGVASCVDVVSDDLVDCKNGAVMLREPQVKGRRIR
jgi:hypothetical protein